MTAQRCPVPSGDALRRKPTTGIAGCCVCAANGHAAAAPPSSVMNSRRFYCPMPPVLPTERIAHLNTAGDCCAAAFRSDLCRRWVRSVELVPFATFPLYSHEPT
jgi:hypothetical protein